MRRAVANQTTNRKAKPRTESDDATRSHIFLEVPSARKSDERRKRPGIREVGRLLMCIVLCSLIGYWGENILLINHAQFAAQQPVATQSSSNTTTTTTTRKATTFASEKSHCKVLSIYPPHLHQEQQVENNLCGHLFYPFDFAQREVPSTYNWKRTGYEYYAAGIGLHHVTFDVSPSSRHNLIYNSMMKCGSTSVNRALKELKQAAKENFPHTPMTVVYQGKQNNLLAKESQRIMNDLYQHQQQNQQFVVSGSIPPTATNATFHYFTTVRDPVSRFVSAIAQEMYVRRNDPKAQGYRDKCLLETPQKTLECSIRHVEDRFEGKDELDQPHFIPMTTILYRRSYGFNVSVALFSTDQVSRIVSRMVAPSRLTTFETKKNALKAQGSQVLKNMTVSDLTPNMKLRICKLYELDVRMMKQAGFTTICS